MQTTVFIFTVIHHWDDAWIDFLLETIKMLLEMNWGIPHQFCLLNSQNNSVCICIIHAQDSCVYSSVGLYIPNTWPPCSHLDPVMQCRWPHMLPVLTPSQSGIQGNICIHKHTDTAEHMSCRAHVMNSTCLAYTCRSNQEEWPHTGARPQGRHSHLICLIEFTYYFRG